MQKIMVQHDMVWGLLPDMPPHRKALAIKAACSSLAAECQKRVGALKDLQQLIPQALLSPQRTIGPAQHRGTPGTGSIPCIGDALPLVGLFRGVQGPGVCQRLLAVVAPRVDQEAVGNHGQHMGIARARPRTRNHHPGHQQVRDMCKG